MLSRREKELPNFEIRPEKNRGKFMANLRKFIISRKPLVNDAARDICRRIFQGERMLPDFKIRPEKNRGKFMANLRKFIISRKPLVNHAARDICSRIRSKKMLKVGDETMRRGKFDVALEIYEKRHDWLGMAVAQMNLGNRDGALKTLNEKHLFSKKAAALFLKLAKNQGSMKRDTSTSIPVRIPPQAGKKEDTGATREEKMSIKGTELF